MTSHDAIMTSQRLLCAVMCFIVGAAVLLPSCDAAGSRLRLRKAEKILVELLNKVEKDSYMSEASAQRFLAEMNEGSRRHSRAYALRSYEYHTNLTEDNSQKLVEAELRCSNWNEQQLKEIRKFYKHIDSFSDYDVIRQLTLLVNDDSSSSNEDDIRRRSEVKNSMSQIYSSATVDDLHLDPDITRIMAKSRDYEKLKYYWAGWRDAVAHPLGSPPLRELYTEYVELSNKGAQEKGFADMGEAWRLANYEMRNLSFVDQLWDEMLPLYEQLHAFVRRRLVVTYPDQLGSLPEDATIPAHIFGDMWAQQWAAIADLCLPYPDVTPIDLTHKLKDKGYTAEKMFKEAENFYVSIGLSPMTQMFWNKSMITKPDDGREVVCHASAGSFYDKANQDYRIKMCTVITSDDFQTVHHEMGHVEYYMEYKGQPMIYRDGANAGFHEAIGDTIALSVMTPGHLVKLGIVSADERPSDKTTKQKETLNMLMKVALVKIAFLPFGLLIDKYRWKIFNGDIPADEYNAAWWKMREEYQGISAPVERTENDFDAGAKFHVPDNTPYIRYFFSFILQFQFHKSLCDAAGHNGPVYECDIYQSKEAGNQLSEMLSAGRSRPWQETLYHMTGSRDIDTAAIWEYFQPLYDWLQNENDGEVIGWKTSSQR